MKKHLQRILFLLIALTVAFGAVSALSDETEVRIITITWMDSDNYDNIRPTTPLSAKLGDQTVSLTEANGWTAAVEVPAGSTDTWQYETIPGYQADLSSPRAGTSVLTYTHKVPKINVTGRVNWDDGENARKTRPDSVQIMLYADGEPYGEPLKATPSDWERTWKNVPKRKPGSENDITYTVKQLQTPDGYESSASGLEVKNTLQLSGLTVTASVTGDGIADPGAVTVKVDGPDPSMPKTLGLGTHDLGEVLPGAYIVYSPQTIELADGYVMDAANSKVCDAVYVAAGKQGALEFKYASKEQEAQEAPEDYDPWAGVGDLTIEILGPDPRMPITLKLKDDFKKVDETIYRYEGDALKNLVPGVYAVVERNAETLVSYYYLTSDSITAISVKVDPGKTENVQLFDRYVPVPTPEPDAEFVDIPVTKTWNDNNDKDGNRPASITARLYADGVEVDSHVLTAENGWSYTFKDKPRYQEDNKTEIVYSVNEDKVAMYALVINGFNLVNNYTPEETSVSVAKVWQDQNDKQNRRPKSIVMTLSDGVKVVAKVILNEKNGWSATVDHLPTKVNGKPAVYTWTEQEALGYELISKEVIGNKTVFTNAIYERPDTPQGGRKPKGPGDTTEIEEYRTPLGVEIMINHVGDCFD